MATSTQPSNPKPTPKSPKPLNQPTNNKPSFKSPNKTNQSQTIPYQPSNQHPNHPKVSNPHPRFKVESGSEGAIISEGYQSEVYFCTRTFIDKESLVTIDRKSTFRTSRRRVLLSTSLACMRSNHPRARSHRLQGFDPACRA